MHVNIDHKNCRRNNVKYKKHKKKMKKELEKLSFELIILLLGQWGYRRDDQKNSKKKHNFYGKKTLGKKFALKGKNLFLLEFYFINGGTQKDK